MRRMRDAGAPGAIPEERICTLWREYRLATKLAGMNARHAAKMAEIESDIQRMRAGEV
jgi:hypothetical protein